MTKLYWADVTALEEEGSFHRLLNQVGQWRREKIEKLRFPEDKRLSLGAGLLLEYALKQWGLEAVPPISCNAHGKPFLPGENQPHFNLSHSGKIVLCAVSDGEVGCDVQKKERYNPKLAARRFAPAEVAWLHALPEEAQADGFFRIWTLKESFLKAVGRGLSLPLQSFSFVLTEETVRVEQTDFPDRPFFFREWVVAEDYRCACCAGDGDFSAPEEVILTEKKV